VKAGGEFGFDFGEGDFSSRQEHQEVVEDVGGFAEGVLATLFAGFSGR
jgi:hypothetical protein